MDEHWKIINAGGLELSNTPETLWKQAAAYFKWCDDNPITAKRTLTSGKTQGDKVVVEYKRPYSIEGMCMHCNISKRYINDLQDEHSKDSEYYMVMEKILMVIYTQNLEGAIVDLYNPIMVSKVLNMDKPQENSNSNIRVEIISGAPPLANSESEVLKKLDFDKMETLKEKVENPDRQKDGKEEIGLG